jgi:hypothetical protein
VTASATQEGSIAIGVLSRPLQRVPDETPAEPLAVSAGEATSTTLPAKRRMWERMVRECEAMVQHALSTGRVVPAEVMLQLDQAVSSPDPPGTDAPDRRDDPPGDVAAGSSAATGTSRFVALAMAHAGLALAIAPATPEAVLLMADERERHPLRCEFGPLPLVRQMLGLALFSLLVLLGISISTEVSNVNVSKSLLELSGYPLLMVEAFLVSAASRGACFANLQRINTVISDGTYDPRIQSTYWTRWVMGVISGIVLSQIVYAFFLARSGDDPTVHATMAAIEQPLLALLGGYSVDFRPRTSQARDQYIRQLLQSRNGRRGRRSSEGRDIGRSRAREAGQGRRSGRAAPCSNTASGPRGGWQAA